MRTLIKNATVVLPAETAQAHVLIDGATIADIDAPASMRADAVVDASGLHLLPGAIDDQVHFRDPGLTHKEKIIHKCAFQVHGLSPDSGTAWHQIIAAKTG